MLKGSVRTKYGTRKEYLDAIEALHKNHINVYADIVLNHKMGADEVEEVSAQEFNAQNRYRWLAMVKPSVPGQSLHSQEERESILDFTWNWTHFDGIDWDQNRLRQAIYKFAGKEWNLGVDTLENGNYDYLMGADIDFNNQEVFEELVKWAVWYVKETNIDGFRLML